MTHSEAITKCLIPLSIDPQHSLNNLKSLRKKYHHNLNYPTIFSKETTWVNRRADVLTDLYSIAIQTISTAHPVIIMYQRHPRWFKVLILNSILPQRFRLISRKQQRAGSFISNCPIRFHKSRNKNI